MRKYVVLFSLAVFLAIVAYYLAYVLPPLNVQKTYELAAIEGIKEQEELIEVIFELKGKGLLADVLSVPNLIIVLSTSLASIFCIFVFLHLLVDKLIFRQFYQRPALFTALRRGVIFIIGLIAIFLYRLFAAEWYLSALTIFLLISLEAFLWRFLQNRQRLQAEKKQQSEDNLAEQEKEVGEDELSDADNQNEQTTDEGSSETETEDEANEVAPTPEQSDDVEQAENVEQPDGNPNQQDAEDVADESESKETNDA